MGWFEDRFKYSEGKLQVICTVCGGGFWLPISKASRYKRCTPECVALHAEQVKKSRLRKCLNCGAEFSARAARGGRCSYCSLKCSTAVHTERNSPEAMLKRKETFARSMADGRILIRSGPDHPQWTGGAEASMKRRRDSGMDSIRAARYRKSHPEKVREWKTKRGRGYLEKLPRGTIKKIGNAQKWKCAICKISVAGGYHVDHIMPIALGGLHEPLNLQILCQSCNVRKNAKHPTDYMRERGFLL